MRVSVIISNRNDVSMLLITIRSALEEISAVPGGGEVVVVDNSDEEIYEDVKNIIPAQYIRDKTVRLIRQDFTCLFTARETAAKQANGEYIICLDSHMLSGHNSIIDAVHFMNRHKNDNVPVGFAHMPLNWLGQHHKNARHDMMYLHGGWGTYYTVESPMLTWKGMPWICRREWFINKLNSYGLFSENKLSWGGGDMYLGLKSTLLGYQNWAIPTRPMLHIGPFPPSIAKHHRYRLYNESGSTEPCIGFMAALHACGADKYLNTKTIDEFFTNRIGGDYKKHVDKVKEISSKDREWIAKNRSIDFESYKTNMLNAQYTMAINEMRKITKVNKCIKFEDYLIIYDLCLQLGIKTYLEFGMGLSTILLSRHTNVDMTTYETDRSYINLVLKMIPYYKRRSNLWSNASIKKDHNCFDLVLVDGCDPRENQIKIASNIATKAIIVHDGYTRPNPKSIEKYLVSCGWEEKKVASRRSRLFVK